MGKGFTGAHRKKRSVWHEIGGLAAKKNRALVPFIVEAAPIASKERSASVLGCPQRTATNGNERQRTTTNDNERQRVAAFGATQSVHALRHPRTNTMATAHLGEDGLNSSRSNFSRSKFLDGSRV